MNILLINHYAGTTKYGMEYRSHYLAREWARLGHCVTVVGASRSHLRIEQPRLTGSILEEEFEGVHYVWLKTPNYHGNGMGRVLNILAFVAQLWRYRGRLARRWRPQAVIAASTYRFEVYSARAIARKCRATLIYEVRDLWPLTQIEVGGMSPWHPFVMMLQRAENYAYRHADRVVSTLPGAEEHLRRHGLAADRFTYIPNGIDVQQWRSRQLPLPDEHARALEMLRCQGRFLVGYAGTHGCANSLDSLVDAAAILKEQPLAFVLVGQGLEKERLRAKAAQLGLDSVRFLPSVPKASIPALLACMDALYLGWPRRSIYRFGISPNKLLDYMMAGKPVVHGVEAANDPVADSGCGVSCAPDDPSALAGALLDLLGRSPEEREAMGRRGQQHVLEHYDYTVLARRFLDVMIQKQ
jgi:glycosyltransferase involved in cell wall biosynthesis